MPTITRNALAVAGQQQKVLAKLLQGMSDLDIADSLGLHPRTVRGHLLAMYRRFGITGGRARVQLVWLARSAAGVVPRSFPGTLTSRQWEVLMRARRGLSNKEIAQELGISPGGVSRSITLSFGKLGVSSSVELALWATGGADGETDEC